MKKQYMISALLLGGMLCLTACGGTQAESTSEPTVSAEGESIKELTGGDSMENAEEIAVNTKYNGSYEEGEAWFSFKTGEQEDIQYAVTLTNLTSGSKTLDLNLYDAENNRLDPTDRSYYEIHGKFVGASEGGMAGTGWIDTLVPDTTYFLCIEGGSEAEYSLKITDPSQEAADETERINITDAAEYYTAANMDDAPLLAVNTKYYGSYDEGPGWTAFRTGEKENTKIAVTLDNHTQGGKPLGVWLYDEFGRAYEPTERTYYETSSVKIASANDSGTAATGWIGELDPDTTYFLLIQGDSKADYSIRISDPSQESAAEEGRDSVPDKDSYFTAASMDEAPLLTANTRYHGEYSEGYAWVAFKTGEEEDAEYSLTLENLTVNSEELTLRLYDEYGKELLPTRRSYSEVWEVFLAADQSGTASTGWIDTLEPDSIYFVRLNGDSKAEYTLMYEDGTSESTDTSNAFGVEGNVDQDLTIIPGTSQSSAITLPLGTRVYGKYAEGYAWLAFSTTEQEGAEYYITAVNRSAGSEELVVRLYDEYGKELSPAGRSYNEVWSMFTAANQDGTAVSGVIDTLEPNSTYYVRLNSDSKVDYSVLISSPGQESSAYKTSSNIEASIPALGESDEYYTGTNQNEATMLKTNIRYHGSYKDGYAWVSFTTGEQEDIEYSITLENLTAGSGRFIAQLFDEYGYKVQADRRSYNEVWDRFTTADESGTAATGWTAALEPGTTYYIRLEAEDMPDEIEYILLIGEPETEQEGNTIAVEPEEEAVFEVPFELNETQVRFVADQAVFIDEEAAKEALEPVAQVILEHPDHAILLAGTTATFGSQEACVKLSNARAEAVKNMLVDTFGVPADQLLTVGLGYEADPFERGRDVDANGQFVSTEAAKNRRVIVMDAETEIAEQLLGN